MPRKFNLSAKNEFSRGLFFRSQETFRAACRVIRLHLAVLVHPAIYQFIREEEVDGVHRFVFGKHSGAGALEEVLKKNEELLEAHGVTLTDDLVRSALERVKEIRGLMIEEGSTKTVVNRYYEDYHRLGITETALVEIVLEMGKSSVLSED